VASTYVDVLQDAILETAEDPARGHDAPFLWEEAFENIITGSQAMAEVLRLCTKVAPSPYTVLFTGETGTGKGLLAYSLHRLSPRGERRFVAVNCAAIPETLLESELFGYVKGAFTGADGNKEGLIRGAHGGTLFLDEVGKMSLPMQAKLLHFLDSKDVRPVGGSESFRVDVRILCASKRNLKQMVEQELFLEDLYYRLLDFPIDVPPLRERADDILLLARHYVARAAEELGRPVPRMTRAFATQLRSWSWPGNVRELEKTIKRTVVMAGDEDRLRVRHLPVELRGRDAADGSRLEGERHPQTLKDQVAEFEAAILQRALDAVGWNRSEAARRLKISYPTLLQKIKVYGLKAH
jgi:transcriptional regulator with PAS, ATPase and Fis domain